MCAVSGKEATPMPATERGRWWRYLRGLAGPLLLWGLVIATMREPIQTWLGGEQKYDQAALKEWIQEARVSQTLPEMIDNYLTQAEASRAFVLANPEPADPEAKQFWRFRKDAVDGQLSIRREEIHEH